ncbi:MAG: hypothetical protein ACUVQ8_06905 [Nitrososphaeria archaeon]
MKVKLEEFVREYGKPFSEMLGINLKSRENKEIVKWFLASILYSKPIREGSATRTYLSFLEHGVSNVDEILNTGWQGLVDILDNGSYTRYDFSTADKILEVFGNLQRSYRGDLNKLHEEAKNSEDLEMRIKELGKGIGDTTVLIFLREMRYVWEKADPKPSPLVRLAMEGLGITDIKKVAEKKKIDLIRLETALLRYGKDFLRKGKRLEIEVGCI